MRLPVQRLTDLFDGRSIGPPQHGFELGELLLGFGLDAACLRALALVTAASVETLFFLLIMDSFALHLAGVVAGAPCIRLRCPHVQVEAQIMPLLSSLPTSHSMAGKNAQIGAQARHRQFESHSTYRIKSLYLLRVRSKFSNPRINTLLH